MNQALISQLEQVAARYSLHKVNDTVFFIPTEIYNNEGKISNLYMKILDFPAKAPDFMFYPAFEHFGLREKGRIPIKKWSPTSTILEYVTVIIDYFVNSLNAPNPKSYPVPDILDIEVDISTAVAKEIFSKIPKDSLVDYTTDVDLLLYTILTTKTMKQKIAEGKRLFEENKAKKERVQKLAKEVEERSRRVGELQKEFEKAMDTTISLAEDSNIASRVPEYTVRNVVRILGTLRDEMEDECEDFYEEFRSGKMDIDLSEFLDQYKEKKKRQIYLNILVNRLAKLDEVGML